MAVRFGSSGTSYLEIAPGALDGNSFGFSYYLMIPSGGTLTWNAIVTSNTYNPRFWHGLATDGLTIYLWTGNGGVSGTTLKTNRWYHVAVRHISGVGADLYLDGVLDITVNNPSTLTTATTRIGCDDYGGGSSPANLYIDNFILWNGATPSVQEITSQRFQRAPIRRANLHSWLEMKPGARNLDSWGGNTWTPTGTILDAPSAPVPYSPFVPYVLMPQPAAGGTTYTQSIAGSMTPAGTLLKQDNKVVSGALTFVGTLTKQPRKVLAGGITPSATVSKQAAKPLTGSVTPSGTLVKQANKVLAAALTSAGTLARRTNKAISGAITPSATLIKQVNKSFAGGITPSGTVARVKVALLSLTAALTPSGTLTKQVNKPFAGAITSIAGTLTKQVRKSFAGGITPSGTLTRVKVALLTLTASLTPSGTLVKQTNKSLVAVLTPSATLTKRIAKSAFTAVLSLAGTLEAVGSGAAALLPLAGTILDAIVYGAQLADTLNYTSSIGDEANFTGSVTINPDH